jgi:aspartyl protease family protein
MSADQGSDIAYIMLAMLLPLSALVARRLPLRTIAPMALAWLGIFLVGLVAIGLSRLPAVRAGWAQVTRLIGDDEQSVQGRTMVIGKARDGHFWATATIDGVARRMLVDSGATTTSLSEATARAARLDLEQPFATSVETANGTVIARPTSVKRLELGAIVARDLRVIVAPEFGDVDVLGMNFLSRLKSWRVEGDRLVLEPAPQP